MSCSCCHNVYSLLEYSCNKIEQSDQSVRGPIFHFIYDHGISQLHISVRSLRFLHHLGPVAVGGVNRVETYTSVCNLYL